MKRQGVAGNPGKGVLTPGGPCPVCSASDAQGPLKTDLFDREGGERARRGRDKGRESENLKQTPHQARRRQTDGHGAPSPHPGGRDPSPTCKSDASQTEPPGRPDTGPFKFIPESGAPASRASEAAASPAPRPPGPSTTLPHSAPTACTGHPRGGRLPQAPQASCPPPGLSLPSCLSPHSSHIQGLEREPDLHSGARVEAESLRVPSGGSGRCSGEGRGLSGSSAGHPPGRPRGRDVSGSIYAPWRWQVCTSLQGHARSRHPSGWAWS